MVHMEEWRLNLREIDAECAAFDDDQADWQQFTMSGPMSLMEYYREHGQVKETWFSGRQEGKY